MNSLFTALINRIKAAIKSNDVQEITGNALQTALTDMVNTTDKVISDQQNSSASEEAEIYATRASEYGRGFRSVHEVNSGAGTNNNPYQIWVGSEYGITDGGLGKTHFILDLASPAENGGTVFVNVGRQENEDNYPSDEWNAREAILIVDNGDIGDNAYGEIRLTAFGISKGVKLCPGFNCISVLLKGQGNNANTYDLYAYNQALQESQQCLGEATPSTNPGNTDNYFGFYIAKTPGTYTHFKTFINNTYNPIVVSPGEYAVLYRSYEHDWLKAAWTGITVDDAMSDTSTNPVQNRVIAEKLQEDYVSKSQLGEQLMEGSLHTEKSLKADVSVATPSHDLLGGGSYGSVPADESIPEGGDLDQQLDRKGYTRVCSDDGKALKMSGDNGVYLDGNGEGEYLMASPDDDSDDTQIATTEWVNDKISAGGETDTFDGDKTITGNLAVGGVISTTAISVNKLNVKNLLKVENNVAEVYQVTNLYSADSKLVNVSSVRAMLTAERYRECSPEFVDSDYVLSNFIALFSLGGLRKIIFFVNPDSVDLENTDVTFVFDIAANNLFDEVPVDVSIGLEMSTLGLAIMNGDTRQNFIEIRLFGEVLYKIKLQGNNMDFGCRLRILIADEDLKVFSVNNLYNAFVSYSYLSDDIPVPTQTD